MPNDLDPRTAVFTYQNMKLLYKEGITEQWISKLVENEGWNRFQIGRLLNQVPIGTSPAPVLGEEFGLVRSFGKTITTDGTPYSMDTSVDWRDRHIFAAGIVTEDSTSYQDGTSTMKDAFATQYYDQSTSAWKSISGTPGTCAMTMAYCYTGPGGYGYRASLIFSDTGTIVSTFSFYADASTGNLIALGGKTGGISNGISAYGIVVASPKRGYQSL